MQVQIIAPYGKFNTNINKLSGKNQYTLSKTSVIWSFDLMG